MCDIIHKLQLLVHYSNLPRLSTELKPLENKYCRNTVSILEQTAVDLVTTNGKAIMVASRHKALVEEEKPQYSTTNEIFLKSGKPSAKLRLRLVD